MFDDYVLYLLESLHCQERANDLMRAMKGEGSIGETAKQSIINKEFLIELCTATDFTGSAASSLRIQDFYCGITSSHTNL